jgi:hypothetical protein
MNIQDRMAKLLGENVEEAAEEAAESTTLKTIADQVVVGLLPTLPDDPDAAAEVIVQHLKQLVAHKALLKTALKRMNVGSRAKRAAKALAKEV